MADKATYAKGTTVTAERSRAEIESLLTKYGATSFAYGWHNNEYMIAFELHERRYKMELTFPNRKEFKGHYARNGRYIDGSKDYEQATMERWRVLVLWLKALLVVVETKLISMEQAMEAFLMLPDGRNVDQWLAPKIKELYETGQVPQLMSGNKEGHG